LAKALVAALDARVQIVNLSLAGPEDLLLHDLIQEGVRRGIIFVGAAPGSDANTGDSLLSKNSVIAVATAEEPHAINSVIYAPGREILTLLPGGHYGFASGSSLATAHVTGAVALLLAKHPALTYATVYQLLNNSTAHVTSINGAIDSVDACAAVAALLGRGTCNQAESSYGQMPRSNVHQFGMPAISQAK
jgi:subtilisin family serine protease